MSYSLADWMRKGGFPKRQAQALVAGSGGDLTRESIQDLIDEAIDTGTSVPPQIGFGTSAFLKIDNIGTVSGSSASSTGASFYHLKIDGSDVANIAPGLAYNDDNWIVSRVGTDLEITSKVGGLFQLQMVANLLPAADCEYEVYFSGLPATSAPFAPVADARYAGAAYIYSVGAALVELTADTPLVVLIDGWYNGGGTDPGDYATGGIVDIRLVEVVATSDPT
jgi:hypothetical protein